MEGAGFTPVTVQYEHLRFEQNLRDWLETVRRRDTCSQLQSISDAAYAAGVRRLERELADGSAPATRSDHLCLVTIRGDKPNGGHLSAPRRWMPAEELPHRPFYDGATLHVRSYDSMNSGDRPVRRGDVSFYLDLARRAGGEVLEIGVGTGRVALQLAKAGVRVTGLDLSPDMLAIAAEKAAASRLVERLRLERGDMRNFDLATRDFGLVIVPYRAFQILLTPEDQFAALAAFRRHLRKGGILALHLFDPDLRFLLPGATGPVDRARCVDRSTGRTVEAVLETALFDHVNQTRRDLWRYRTFAPDGTIAEEEALELSIRWSFRWEMRHLLQFAGFAVEAEFSDFLGSPPAYGKEQIWVARNS